MTTSTLPVDVGSRRRAARLSQLELAERASCSESTIRLFERGYTPRHSETLERVLATLDQAELECQAVA